MGCNSGCDVENAYYVGDVGTVIIVDLCNDITAATLVALDVVKPDGTQVRWSGSVWETTKIRYVVGPNDLNVAGEYRIQPYLEILGWSGHAKTSTFKVLDVYQ